MASVRREGSFADATALRDWLEGPRGEVVKARRGRRESGGSELVGWKLGLESLERRARREAVRGRELLVAECEGEHRRGLLALTVAWGRVKGNAGARSAGVDGETVRDIEAGRGAEAFLCDLRAVTEEANVEDAPADLRGGQVFLGCVLSSG